MEDEKVKIYSSVIGKSIQSTRDEEDVRSLYCGISDNPRHNFKVTAELDKAAKVVKITPLINKGDVHNFNFLPYAKQCINHPISHKKKLRNSN